MEQLTVRGFDDDLARLIRTLARDEGISLSKAAIRLMRRGANLDCGPVHTGVGHALDDFIGVWTEAEQREFDSTVEQCFEQVDAAACA